METGPLSDSRESSEEDKRRLAIFYLRSHIDLSIASRFDLLLTTGKLEGHIQYIISLLDQGGDRAQKKIIEEYVEHLKL